MADLRLSSKISSNTGKISVSGGKLKKINKLKACFKCCALIKTEYKKNRFKSRNTRYPIKT